MSTYNHLTLNERIKIMTMAPKKIRSRHRS